VGLLDSAAQAIHLRTFLIGQGYVAAISNHDNLSSMALVKRGGPGSEKSRHINIRHLFWQKGRQSVTRERVRFASLPMARAVPPTEVVPRARSPEVRTCYEYNTVGHIHRDCPRRVLVTVDDEVDEDVLYEAAMLYDDNTYMMRRCVLAQQALRDTVSNDIDAEPDRSRVRA